MFEWFLKTSYLSFFFFPANYAPNFKRNESSKTRKSPSRIFSGYPARWGENCFLTMPIQRTGSDSEWMRMLILRVLWCPFQTFRAVTPVSVGTVDNWCGSRRALAPSSESDTTQATRASLSPNFRISQSRTFHSLPASPQHWVTYPLN